MEKIGLFSNRTNPSKIAPRKRSVLAILGFGDLENNNFCSLDIRA